MVAQSNAAVEQVVALFRPAAYYALECTTISLTTLVVYDWMVTLSREIDLFWTGNTRCMPAVLYFANKYLNLVSCVVSMLQMAPMSNELHQGSRRNSLLSYLSLLPPAGFTALRAYALTRCRWLSALVFVLLCIQVVLNMAALIWFHVFGIYSTAWGCIVSFVILPSSPLGQMRLIVNRVSSIIADAILVFVTWKVLHGSTLTTNSAMTLASVMFCNGILYFVVLTLLNVVQLVLTVGFPIAPDGLALCVWYYIFPMSSVLVSHFLLDLQEAHRRTVIGLATGDTSAESQDVGGSIQFASSLGSVGTIVGLAEEDVQEGEGEGGPDDVVADDASAAVEVICPDEGEAIQESRVEDELEIMASPRVGADEGSVRAL